MKLRRVIPWVVLVGLVAVGVVIWGWNRRQNAEWRVLQRGQIAFQHGDVEQAVQHFREAHRRYPDSFTAAYLLASAEIRLGRTEEARRHAEAAAAIAPKRYEPALTRAASYRADIMRKYEALLRTPLEVEFAATETLGAQALQALQQAEPLAGPDHVDVLAERGLCEAWLFRLHRLHEYALRQEAARTEATDAAHAAELRTRANECASKAAAAGETALDALLASLRKQPKNPPVAETAEELALTLGRHDQVMEAYDLLASAKAATERAAILAVQSLVGRAVAPVTADDWNASQRAGSLLESFLKDNPKSVEARVYLTRLLIARGEMESAGKQTDEILKIDPSSGWGRLLRGQLLLAAGEPQKAKEMIQALGGPIARSVEYKLLLAEAQRRTGYPQLERQLYRQVLDLDPANAEAHLAMINGLLADGQTTAAEAQLTTAVTAAPDSEPILRFAAEYYLDRGQEAQALALLERTARRPNLSRPARELLAEMYVRAGAADRAEEILKQAGPAPAGGIRDKYVLANLALARGRFEEARKSLEALVAANPRWPQGHLSLARALAAQRRNEDAAREAALALENAPRDPSIRLAVAVIYAGVGLLDEADTLCGDVLREAPNNQAALNLSARIGLLRGDYEAAAQHLETLNRLKGQRVQDWLIQAELAFRQGQYDKCLDLCRNKAEPEAQWLAAAAMVRQGQPAQAAEQLAQLVEAKPDFGQAYDQLVKVWLSIDTPAGAMERLKGLKNAKPLPLALSKGAILVAMGKPDEAIALYNPLLADKTLAASTTARRALRTAIATCCRLKNDTAGELKQYEALAADNDTRLAGSLQMVQFYRRQNQNDRAAEVLDRISRETGDDETTVAVRRQLASMYTAVGRTENAVAELNRAIAIRPDSVQLILEKVQAFAAGGQLDDSLATVTDARTRWPDNVQLLQLLADVQAARREYAAAMETLEHMSAHGDSARIAANLNRAVLLVRMGLYADAVAGLQTLLRELPATGRSHLLTIAQAMIGLGQHAEAQAELLKVPETSPQYRAARLMLARDLRATGKTDEAVKIYQALLTDRPADGELAYELCDVLVQASKLAEADKVAAAQEARYAPRTREAIQWRLTRAVIAGRRHDWSAAVEPLEEIVATVPDRREYRWQLALFRLAAGQTQAAARDLDKEPQDSLLAILTRSLADAPATQPASRPGEPPAAIVAVLRNPGTRREQQLAGVLTLFAMPMTPQQVLAAIGEVNLPLTELVKACADSPAASRPQASKVARFLAQAAIADIYGHAWLADYFCEQANQVDGESPWIPIVWQPILNRIGKRAEAARVGAAAEAVVAKTRWGRELAIWKALGADDLDAAVRQIDALPADAPANGTLLLATGAGFMNKGRLEDALQWFEKALAVDPNNPEANNSVAYLLAEVKAQDPAALERAEKLAAKAVHDAPNSPAIRETLGWVRVRRGDAKAALPDLLIALDSLRNDPRMHYHLGVCYEKLGQPGMARMHLANVSKLAGGANLPEAKHAEELLRRLPTTTAPAATAPGAQS